MLNSRGLDYFIISKQYSIFYYFFGFLKRTVSFFTLISLEPISYKLGKYAKIQNDLLVIPTYPPHTHVVSTRSIQAKPLSSVRYFPAKHDSQNSNYGDNHNSSMSCRTKNLRSSISPPLQLKTSKPRAQDQ